MLCSAKRRASLRFVSSLSSSQLRSQPHSRPYDHGSEMASLSVAYCGCGAERSYSVRSVENFPVFLRRFRGFEFRACFEPDQNRRSLHSHGKATRRGGGFDNQKAQFVSDLEVKRVPPLREVRQDGRSFAPSGCEKAYEHGNLLRHSAHSFPGEKFAVAVDVDEVLGNFVSALNKFIADRYSLSHSVSEYHVYEFFKIWNCSRDEADIRVHEFFKTSYFKSGIHPIPGAQKALHKLSKFCNLSVVTSRQNAIKDHTIEWIEKYYPGLFTEIHFGNHFALNGESRPKSDICRSLGAKVLIDDNPRYAIECADAGMRVLLFDYENSYPWCKTDSIDQHPLVTKVHNWEEVEQQLNTWVLN